jgi:hypothetical protein
MTHRVQTPRLVAVAVGVMLAVLTPVSGAMATDPDTAGSIDIQEQATLLSRGAAVELVVTVSCSPEFGQEFLSVSLRQRQGNEIVDSGTGAYVDCAETPKTMTLNVQAGEAPFRRGPAFVTASMYQIGRASCRERV